VRPTPVLIDPAKRRGYDRGPTIRDSLRAPAQPGGPLPRSLCGPQGQRGLRGAGARLRATGDAGGPPPLPADALRWARRGDARGLHRAPRASSRRPAGRRSRRTCARARSDSRRDATPADGRPAESLILPGKGWIFSGFPEPLSRSGTAGAIASVQARRPGRGSKQTASAPPACRARRVHPLGRAIPPGELESPGVAARSVGNQSGPRNIAPRARIPAKESKRLS
jgi:hypothetical protein